MAKYQAKANEPLSFDVTKDGRSIGKISYQNWFRFKAVIEVASKTYQLTQKGFWGTSIELRDGEKLLQKFAMNWNGDLAVRRYWDGAEQQYLFKHHGIFKESFTLNDQEETELFMMKPRIKWRMMNYEYEITTSDAFEALQGKELILTNAVYWANYYMFMMAGVS